MASNCCVCNKKIGLFDAAYLVVDSQTEYQFCAACHAKRELLEKSGENEFEERYTYFSKFLSDESLPNEIKNYFYEMDGNVLGREKITAMKREMRERELAAEKAYEDLFMTTGTGFDGYVVKKYIDVICEEIIFKNSFMNRLSAGVEDIFNALSFQERELSGSSGLITRARNYVKEKFCRRAVEIGANAVLGVKFESAIGSEIVRVAIFGTAVYVEKAEGGQAAEH